uniref:Katanin_con80 domain-containing protein n=1 Tax=Anopheles quadriannulatus TaxID=34691 RepID=A0A182XNJ6_ANOQN
MAQLARAIEHAAARASRVVAPFHCTRACDTLRVILSTFLPVIRENTDPWGACTIGVDVSREERQSKCLECKNWLLRIRCLPENPKMGSNLQQLQNMIVDI